MMPMVFPPPFLAAQGRPQQQAFRALYDWGFASPAGEGKGTMAVLVDTSTGRVVVELHALGERMLLLEGNDGDGYRVRMPRNGIDERAPSLRDLPVPFLPALDNAAGLARLLLEGTGPGIRAGRRDGKGPKRLRWDGEDDRGGPCTIWLKRTRFEALRATPD